MFTGQQTHPTTRDSPPGLREKRAMGGWRNTPPPHCDLRAQARSVQVERPPESSGQKVLPERLSQPPSSSCSPRPEVQGDLFGWKLIP